MATASSQLEPTWPEAINQITSAGAYVKEALPLSATNSRRRILHGEKSHSRTLHIMQVNQANRGGPAIQSELLHRAYQHHGHTSTLLVGRAEGQQTTRLQVLDHQRYRHPWARAWQQIGDRLAPLEKQVEPLRYLRRLIEYVGQPRNLAAILRGREEFEFPATWRLLDLPSRRPDLLHCHNLHGGFFDLRALPWLSAQLPVVITLHDAWLLSGHCSHSFGCERWQHGCGHCPDLRIYPLLLRDGTAQNWQHKRSLYAQSRLYVTTPCHWLMQKVENSMLAPALAEARVIPHGIDLNIFQPIVHEEVRARVRADLGITPDTTVLLFTANRIRKNQFKDYPTLEAAVTLAIQQLPEQKLLLLALGEEAPPQMIGQCEVRFIPYQSRPEVMALYYQAADLYLHAAKADTFPLVILEAQACGLPVIATAIDGIPEQIEEGVTGFLTPPKDSQAMAVRIQQLVNDPHLRRQMGHQAVLRAQRLYDAERMAVEHLTWFAEIIAKQEMKK